ncbi:MAG: glycosyltransferase [Burkholderiaceae bacterium]
MHVLFVNRSPIPVFAYGGTERVIWDLGRALVRLKYKVTFLVPRGSYCEFADVLVIDEHKRIEDQIPDDIDLIHFQFKPDHPEIIRKPWLMTQHGNSQVGERLPQNNNFVSQDHAARHGSDCYVRNGLNWDDYGKVDLQGNAGYAHFLGKAAWRVKNVKGAIDVACEAGVHIKVLCGTRLNLKRGFRYTWTRQASFYGMVGGEKKLNLLRASAGLIFPVRWQEPFGLAVIESMYFGAPVFATPYGAMPELVDDKSGVLATNVHDLATAWRSFNADRRYIHERTQETFSANKMAESYVQLYEKIMNGESLNATLPEMTAPAKALPWE